MRESPFMEICSAALAMAIGSRSAIFTGMRLLILLLLMVALPVNAAYAAAAGVCDSIAGHVQSCTFFGHHTHVHEQERHEHHGHDVQSEETPASAPVQAAACDHNHTHAHPLFSVMLPAPLKLQSPAQPGAGIELPAAAFISAPPTRLERPPQSLLVA
ncbi:exported protein of unknown function [Sterolibacterium denitrificans]|uniref:Uncharacterized protein n=1 Tax=Sterolibacterium denitrificans TaxID=157592 RepID=A0A7Z7MW86_9PROT|nr:hypothetical protein [Sterolibacterium denitrificans]SMB28999.1 exported protein of unknown function [Sterolibacterium denitrificans]